MSGSGNFPGGGRGPSRTFQTPAGFRDSPDPVLAAGEVVASQYIARREVARAEGAALIEAWYMLLERTVLLKVAYRDAGTPSLLAEARRCSGVASDAAAAVYSVGNHRGVEFIAGERLLATTLREHLRGYAAAGARMSADELLALFTRVARAVESIHSAGFTIGDLDAETIALVGMRRLVFGRFSLGQVAILPSGLIWCARLREKSSTASRAQLLQRSFQCRTVAFGDIYGKCAISHNQRPQNAAASSDPRSYTAANG